MASRPSDHHQKLLQALIEVGQELASTVELDALLHRILRIAREVFCFENAIIRLLDPERQVLVTAASYGYSDPSSSREIALGHGIMGRVAMSGQPMLVADVTQDADYVPGIAGARCELAVPLLARERVIGVFNVESPTPGAFGDEDIPPLVILANQAAIAIENARLLENLRGMSARYRELHQFNSRILQSANLGIYTVDEDFKITSWNRKMEEMSGITESAALQQPLFTLFPRLEEEGFATRLRRVMQRGVPEKLRLTHRNRRGEVRFQKRRLAPLAGEDGPAGVVVLVEDITEFKQLLEQTIQSEKLAEVGRLSAGIAHEVNNPLAVIAYASQLLLREEELSAPQAELVERIDSEVERLKTLTAGLLSFSRAGETRKREVDLNQVIQDVLRLVRYELNKRSVSLEESFDSLPPLVADPNKLKQVFINLIMNAIQALGRHGTLSIATMVVNGAEVEARISDTGPGIPAAILPQIFTPFFTTKKEGEGTGLGLYICRTIVEEHDGRLLVESAEGEGTCFRVVLPLG